MMKKFEWVFASLMAMSVMLSLSSYDKEDDNAGTDNTYVAIDLGLSVKWATFNVGATKPEEYGGFYAWGETEEKSDYSEATYKYYKNGSYIDIGSNISGTEYDVAHVKWGGKWRMPTRGEHMN